MGKTPHSFDEYLSNQGTNPGVETTPRKYNVYRFEESEIPLNLDSRPFDNWPEKIRQAAARFENVLDTHGDFFQKNFITANELEIYFGISLNLLRKFFFLRTKWYKNKNQKNSGPARFKLKEVFGDELRSRDNEPLQKTNEETEQIQTRRRLLINELQNLALTPIQLWNRVKNQYTQLDCNHQNFYYDFQKLKKQGLIVIAQAPEGRGKAALYTVSAGE